MWIVIALVEEERGARGRASLLARERLDERGRATPAPNEEVGVREERGCRPSAAGAPALRPPAIAEVAARDHDAVGAPRGLAPRRVARVVHDDDLSSREAELAAPCPEGRDRARARARPTGSSRGRTRSRATSARASSARGPSTVPPARPRRPTGPPVLALRGRVREPRERRHVGVEVRPQPESRALGRAVEDGRVVGVLRRLRHALSRRGGGSARRLGGRRHDGPEGAAAGPAGASLKTLVAEWYRTAASRRASRSASGSRTSALSSSARGRATTGSSSPSRVRRAARAPLARPSRRSRRFLRRVVRGEAFGRRARPRSPRRCTRARAGGPSRSAAAL